MARLFTGEYTLLVTFGEYHGTVEVEDEKRQRWRVRVGSTVKGKPNLRNVQGEVYQSAAIARLEGEVTLAECGDFQTVLRRPSAYTTSKGFWEAFIDAIVANKFPYFLRIDANRHAPSPSRRWTTTPKDDREGHDPELRDDTVPGFLENY